MSYLLKLDDAEATSPELSGGKGASLARLRLWGFSVPDGFIVRSTAYIDFLGDSADLLRALESLPRGATPEEVSRVADRIRAHLRERVLPGGLVDEVTAVLQGELEVAPFSVRSSATLEDLHQAAFAGAHDTFLNCRGAEEILAKIKACWISLWNPRAIAYRRERGFGQLEASMAVVVQRLVFCEVAGVGFSLDPVSSNLDHLVIDANFGLGESVVGGEAQVDHFVLDKRSLHVIERRVALKTHMVVAAERGTTSCCVPPESAGGPCLNDEALQQLGSLLCRVEARAGFPQDIEWGYSGGELYLLQARPVTTIAPHWTRDESAERFPNVITPLTWDLVEEGFHRSLNDSFSRMGFPPFSGKWFALHGCYVYGNQNAVRLYAGRSVMAPRSFDDLRQAIPVMRRQYAWVQELPVHWARDLDHYLIGIGMLLSEPLADRPLKDVWDFVLRVRQLGSDYFLPNIAISITQGSLYRLMHHLLEMVFGEEGRNLFDALLAHCDTKTGMINRELFQLAALARNDPELVRELSEVSSRKLLEGGLLQRFARFGQAFEKVLSDHGHREIDFDPYHPTWLEAPWFVLDQLRLILHNPPEQTPRERERTARIEMLQAEARLLAAFPEDLRFFAMEMVRLTRAYTTLDDLEHYQTTRITLPFRKGLRELGRRLVDLGVIADPMEIFFAPFCDLDQAVERNDPLLWAALSRTIQVNKNAYLEARQHSPVWDPDGAAPVEPVTENGDLLRGLPGSPGVAEGPVCIVTGEADFARFPPGAVLVARTTSPAWTPLFYCAAAVITESGGPLSHGAVTSREMGIPAVMGVRHLFERVRDGMRVRVNGKEGVVQRIS
ncbi:MAG: phosphoenolpyruvate synthase [Magnetococcales bacterium]|nr:phosphoenolpyruvate synthase [Magnetococcales bacterium]